MPGKGFRYNPKFFGVGLSPIIGNGDLYITANNIGTYKQDLGAGPFNLEVNDPDFELGVAVNAVNQDVFICTTGGSVGLYKQTGGIGSFVLISPGIVPFHVDVNERNGDVFAVVNGDDMYKQTGGVGSFIDQNTGIPAPYDVCVDRNNGDVFICEFNGDIYKQTGGIGSFVLYQSGAYRSVEVNSNTKDVFIVENGVDLFKQSGGTGPFVAQGTGFTSIDDVAVNHTTNDVFITVDDTGVGKILKQTGGTGSFVDQGAPNINWNFIAVSG